MSDAPERPHPFAAAPSAGAPDPLALQAGDRVGEYVLEEPIGEGGCGTVWRARHALLPGKIVAVKLPRDPQLIDILRRESLLQHGLDHPGVLRVLGVDLDAPVPYVVQEHAAGGDLASLLRRENKLPVKRALEIFEEIVEIIAHAHARGVVHCDLKPGNILLDGEGRVRVGDFGLGQGLERLTASALRESIQTGPYTSQGYAGGTWEYMAPEQKPAAGSPPPPDPRADVFSLGIILYEMLTGERPAGRVRLDAISPDLDAVFERCWTSMDRRYRDARELLKAVRRLRGGKALSPPAEHQQPAGAAADRERLPSRLSRFIFTYLIPLALLAGALGLVWHNEQQRRLALELADLDPPDGSSLLFPQIPRDEADELAAIRHRILEGDLTIDGAASLLREFRARCDDPRLVDSARRWEDALAAAREPAEYEIRWRRYRIDPRAYREQLESWLEPGRPDIYIRVHRRRGGRDDLVHDSSGRAVEGYNHDFTSAAEPPIFRLHWSPGDALRLEVREADVLGDDTIAEFRMEGELSILLFSGVRRSPEGHAIELESDFEFGR
ncbi:MAG: serine/threonine protein kinase [Planctomycetes bacterium]|nr:serine/threonine protein kinase [Planctomycetota bacterium]